MPNPGLSTLESHLGYWLRAVSNHVSHQFSLRLETSGVTVAEWVILREMFDQNVTSPGSLAASTGLSRGAVSKLIDRLRAKKLVNREEASGDRRFQDVALTMAGRVLVPRLAALADLNDRECFSGLTDAERQTLLTLLQKLAQANKLSKRPVD